MFIILLLLWATPWRDHHQGVPARQHWEKGVFPTLKCYETDFHWCFLRSQEFSIQMQRCNAYLENCMGIINWWSTEVGRKKNRDCWIIHQIESSINVTISGAAMEEKFVIMIAFLGIKSREICWREFRRLYLRKCFTTYPKKNYFDSHLTKIASRKIGNYAFGSTIGKM